MALTGEAHQIVQDVQGLQDERDEILDMLRIVADGYQGDDGNGCSEVRIPEPVMREISRRAASN